MVKLKAVAQDSMRLRASAGAGSFRREDKLKGYLEAARDRVQTLKERIDEAPAGQTRREQSRRRASARPGEREARIEAARASTTDAEATVIKMGDGGFRPAYDVQFSTDTESQIIVGVDVVSAGSDQGQMAPMVEQVTERCGQTPDEWLVDGA